MHQLSFVFLKKNQFIYIIFIRFIPLFLGRVLVTASGMKHVTLQTRNNVCTSKGKFQIQDHGFLFQSYYFVTKHFPIS